MQRAEISPLKKHIDEAPKLRALRHKRSARRKRLFVLFFILFLAVVVGLVFLARMPRIQLTQVTVSGTEVTSTGDITAHVESYLGGDYYYVIPHRNAFLYPKKKIEADLAASFPRLRDIEVYRANLTTLAVSVREVRGDALWCGTDATTIDLTAQCYFTDNSGVIVAEAPTFSGDVFLRFFGTTTLASGENPIGQPFIQAAAFQNLADFAAHVRDFGFQVQAVTVGSSGEDSLVLDLGSGKTALIRFMDGDDYDMLAANLEAGLTEKDFAAKLAADKQNLQYIDLRFSDKIYYRFSDDAPSI